MIKQEQIFKYLEFMAQMVPTPFYWLNLEGRVIGINDRVLDAIGAPNKDYVIGKTFYELYQNQEIADALQKDTDEVIRTGKDSQREDKIFDVSTGKARYYMATRSPLFNSDGKVIGVIGTSIEITDSKEKERLEQENKTHALSILEQQLEFRKTSAQIAHDISTPLATIKKLIPYCDDLSENSKSALNKSANRIANIAENFVNQYKFKEEQNNKIEQNENKPLILKYLEEVAPIFPAPIYWFDLDSKFLGINKLSMEAIGGKTYSDIVGKTPYEIGYFGADKIVEHNNKVIQTGKTHAQEDVISNILTNEIRSFIAVRSPIFYNGKIIGVVGTSIEITAQKEAERKLSESQVQFRKTVAQVAHDIGSPLAALQMVVPHCDSLPENTRNVLNKSAIRIADIAENLLCQFKPIEAQNTAESVRASTLISAELLEVLTEKKYEYSKLTIDFTSNISQTGAFAFINIDPQAFKRMISNLVNNAVDAFDNSTGTVSLYLDEFDNQVQIILADNGKGMPDSVKEKILNNIEVTAGKTDGHGIGFTQIRDTLTNNDGKLNIESTLGAGTKIILSFPKINPPDWIAERVELHPNDLVVILDDDEAIHGAWETRFEKSAPDVIRQHFKQGNEAISFINSLNNNEKQKIFLLTDYELLKQNLNGLEVIEKTGIKRSVLVTSHHNNTTVREQAKLTNTKILPKSLASDIQINIVKNNQQPINVIEEPKLVDLVILDDDKNLVDAILMFISDDVIVDKYYVPQDLLDNLRKYSKETKFLIDNQYKNEPITGIAIAKQLHEQGYINLNLFSGEYFDKDAEIPSYLNIISKHDTKTLKHLLES